MWIRKWWLKKRAKYHVLQYRAHLDRYDCGAAMAEEVSLDVQYHQKKFNTIMDKLAKIDPDTPETRLRA